MSVLLDAIARRAAAEPQTIALDPANAAALTYAQLHAELHRLAAQVEHDFDTLRPVALQVEHGRDAVLWELALLAAGVPVLSLPTFYTSAQAQHALAASGAQALVASAGVTLLNHAPVALPMGTARITFTSGSTGTPRGVCLSAQLLHRTAQAVVSRVGVEHAGRHLALLPPGILLETVAGLFATLLAGGIYVTASAQATGLANPFQPDFPSMLHAIATGRATSLILVPELLAGLVGAVSRGCPSPTGLSLVAVGGARVPQMLIEQARAAGIPARQGYGLTECGSVVSLQDADDASTDNAGRPLDHLAVSIAADGEIMVAGEMFLGTIGGGNPQSPYATGDIGHLDAAGRLHIDGRKSSLIVTSHGRNVSPEWVEQALLAQPDIAQCMVHGDGLPQPQTLLVPAHPQADLAVAVAAANAGLPPYAQVSDWQEVAHFTADNGLLTGNGRLKRSAINALWLDREPAYFTQLEAATVRQRIAFLSVPQVRAGLAGEIGLATYLDYLTQAFHHVSHTVPLMQAARARLVHRPDLIAALDEYIAEETGHEEWILNDIATAGGDAERARHSRPHAATQAMVDHAYRTIAEGNPAAFFGMVYVLESISVALASKGAGAVAERLGLPPQAFSYLTSHGALDQSHMRFFATLVNSLEDEDDRAAITTMAQEMFGLFGAMFAALSLEPLHEAA